MTPHLYPQLPNLDALSLAQEFASLSESELRRRAATAHAKATFTSTGGTQVSAAHLEKLAAGVRDLVRESVDARAFDSQLTRLLHSTMEVTRAEASRSGVWAFLACVLLPDVVRWRFPGDGATAEDRFTGVGRGARNALGRCWWRGEFLRDDNPPSGNDPYWLVDELGDDEMAGLIERQRAVTSRRVAVALAKALVGVNRKGVSRTALSRDAFKRFLRFGYFVAFDALEPQELRVACESLCYRAARSLERDASPED